MKEDSDQKERCNKKAEGKFGFFEDCQSDTTSKKAKKRSLYKQNIFCSSKLNTTLYTCFECMIHDIIDENLTLK